MVKNDAENYSNIIGVKQYDAREAGLARAFEMDDHSFRLGDRRRYASGARTLITYSDKSYKVTKRIKQGKSRLAPPFDELATWICETWNVHVLNVMYEQRNGLHGPRIEVVLESKADAKSFDDGDFNFDNSKQSDIAARFVQVVNQTPKKRYDVEGLFVIFSAFAPIARQEADSQVSDQEIADLKRQIGNPDLWEISRCFGNVTFMFYTDAQAKEHAERKVDAEYARKYFDILKPHDEFGYLTPAEFVVQFDSKQNFDENYQSNWFYYYK